ncbi:MAG: TIGR02647 family protein [Rhodocyclales bacterium]|nr:TIGR02647 family protein [Rhodocyclales bacterium]
MPYTPDLVDELNALIRFDLAISQQGVKVHKTANAAVIAAVQRLHGKGLLTQVDGGYLTSLGRNAAEHAQAALTLLTAGAALSTHRRHPEQPLV